MKPLASYFGNTNVVVVLCLAAILTGCSTQVAPTPKTAANTDKPAADVSAVSTPNVPNDQVKHSESTSETPVELGSPKAVIEDHVHQFGNMQPHQKRQHAFVIRNEGDAPLKIRPGASSCKCTIGRVGADLLLPGEQSTVILEWQTTTETKLFAHEAEVLTNDPDNPVLVCRVQGTVLQQIETSPHAFTFSGVTPGTAAEMDVMVTSQLWNRFGIEDVKSSMQQLEYDVQTLPSEELEKRKVKSGYRISVKLPDDLPRGRFNEFLSMRLRPEGESLEYLEIPVTGKILRRVAVYGKGIDSFGRIKMGRVPVGQGIKKYFAIKIRDAETSLDVKKLETTPDFLQVSFGETDSKVPGLYRMLVEVPKSAPSSFYTGDQGRLHVEFNNPRLEDLDLTVEFAVGNDT